MVVRGWLAFRIIISTNYFAWNCYELKTDFLAQKSRNEFVSNSINSPTLVFILFMVKLGPFMKTVKFLCSKTNYIIC